MKERLLELGQTVETFQKGSVDFEPTAEVIGKAERFNVKSIPRIDQVFPIYGIPS